MITGLKFFSQCRKSWTNTHARLYALLWCISSSEDSPVLQRPIMSLLILSWKMNNRAEDGKWEDTCQTATVNGAESSIIVSTKSRFSHFYWSMCLGVVPSSCWSFLCDQMCTDRAVSCPGDSSYGTVRKVVPINTSELRMNDILSTAYTFHFVSFKISVTKSHIGLISLTRVVHLGKKNICVP